MINNNQIYHKNQDYQIPQQNQQTQAQSYMIGQPIDYNADNYNNNQMSNNFPQQFQNKQVYILPMANQQNPRMMMNANPDLFNLQFSNPEIIYCTASIRARKKYMHQAVGVHGIINALQQVYSEYNLSFPQLNLIGQFNFLSANQMEDKVIQPIIDNNLSVCSEAIRNGKIVYCCKNLQKRTISYFYYIFILQSIAAILLSIGYPIYLYNSDSASELATPFIIQIIIYYILIILIAVTFIKTLPYLFKVNVILLIITFLYTIVITVVSGFVEFNNDGNNSTGLRFAIQIPCIFILLFSFIAFSVMIVCTKRFLILAKQLDQSEFSDSACI